MTSCMCKSCLVLPVKEEFAQFATIIAFGPFCFYFLDGIKNWIESFLSWTRITLSETRLKKLFMFCHVPEIMFTGCLSSSRKAGGYSISWCEFSSILRLFEHLLPWFFLIFWLALWTFAWLGELSRQHANTAKNRSKARWYFKENRARDSLSLLLQYLTLTRALQVSSAGPSVLLAPSCGLR